MEETCVFMKFLLFVQCLSHKLICCSNSKTQHGVFCNFSLLFINTDFSKNLSTYASSYKEMCLMFHIIKTFTFCDELIGEVLHVQSQIFKFKVSYRYSFRFCEYQPCCYKVGVFDFEG